jgi:hypothetical protein
MNEKCDLDGHRLMGLWNQLRFATTIPAGMPALHVPWRARQNFARSPAWRGTSPRIGLPTADDRVDIERIELDTVASAAGALRSDERGAAAEKATIAESGDDGSPLKTMRAVANAALQSVHRNNARLRFLRLWQDQ